MRIGIDAHSVGMGAGGNETHYDNLIRWIPRVDTRNEYILYFSHLDAERAREYAVNERITTDQLPWKSSYLRVPVALPRVIGRDKLDVFHAQYVLPPFTRCKTLLTVADIAFEHFPEHFPRIQLLRCKLLVPESARKADHILTVSEFSKRDISSRYGIDPAKITVTHHGADESFRPLDRAQCRAQVEAKYGASGPFILYVGRVQARKNLPRLVEAFARLKDRGAPHKLLIVGRRDYQYERLLRAIKSSQVESSVVFTGYVETELLPILFNAAEVFVYPSLFEGFGLPVLEAMACGTPVITSQGSSLEEVAGDAAMLIDPYRTESLTTAFEKMLADSDLREKMGLRGLERKRHFSYEDAAAKVVRLYESLATS